MYYRSDLCTSTFVLYCCSNLSRNIIILVSKANRLFPKYRDMRACEFAQLFMLSVQSFNHDAGRLFRCVLE